MFNRLSRIDLPGVAEGSAPPLLTRVLVTLILLGVVMLLRRGVDLVAPGMAPFALLYPAVLIATLMAGWTSGVALVAIGAVVVWRVVMLHAAGFQADVVSLALYLLSSGAIVVVALGALAWLGDDADVTAHHLGQAFADGEAEPGAAVASGGAGVDLTEAEEEASLLFRRNAEAAVLHREGYAVPAVVEPSFDLDRDEYFS